MVMNALFSFWVPIGSFLLASCLVIKANELMIPIARLPDTRYQLVLNFNKGSGRTVMLLDEKTGLADPVLSSMYSPSRISVLADGSGFSFIENDMIYVKSFLKRLPRVIEPMEPLYHISKVIWKDTAYAVVCAKKGYTSGIFALDLEGKVEAICWHEDRDCYFPCNIGAAYFYIERKPIGSGEWSYAVKRQENGLSETIFSTGRSPIGYLNINSLHKGFFILDVATELDARFARFECIEIVLTDYGWQQQQLFTFSLPIDLIKSDIYEGADLLMPYFDGDNISYVDYRNSDACVRLTYLCK